MGRFVFGILASLTLTACAANHGLSDPIKFVPEVRGIEWTSERLKSYLEPSFYQPSDLTKYLSRHRLLVSGISCFEFLVRIDERSDGYLTGRVKHRNKCNDRSFYDEHSFVPSRHRFETLKAKIAEAKLFRFYPEVWDQDGEVICFDGLELVFERENEQGHGLSFANDPCTATEQMVEIVAMFGSISKDRDVIEFLER